MTSQPHSGLASTVVAIATGALALGLYAALRFPASVAASPTPFILSVVGLLGYVLVGLFARRAPARMQAAFACGGGLGLIVAAAGVVNHTLEVAVSLPPGAQSVLGPGMWGLMFLVFAIACTSTLEKSDSIGLGLLSSAWCGLVYSAVLVAFALVIGLAFMPHMERILAGPFATSGMSDPDAFVARRLATNASSHLFIAPLIALVVGAAGALAHSLLRSVRPRTAIILNLANVMLFSAGVAAIRIATTLTRAQRPPFIQFGLGALLIALASAHPLLAAARRRRGSA